MPVRCAALLCRRAPASSLADPDVVPQPLPGLLDPAYLAGRAMLIDPAHALPAPPAGIPPGAPPAASQPAQPESGTSHLSIIDAEGNAVAMTTSVQDAFGARLLVRGFILNDELPDVSFIPAIGGAPVANAAGPGKRPRSSMSPTLIFDNERRLVGALGSVGGARIISYVAQALVNLIDVGMTPQDAAAAPHIGVTGRRVELEAGTQASTLAPPLAALGHTLASPVMESGTQIIMRGTSGWIGGADRRREGVARGVRLTLPPPPAPQTDNSQPATPESPAR